MKNRLIIFSMLLFPVSILSQITFSSSQLPHVVSSDFLMGGGVAVFDYDSDGDEDFYISSGMGRDHLYENDGSGGFTEVGISKGLAITEGINTFGVIAGDIENDGDKDLFITTWLNDDSLGNEILQPNLLLRNDAGVFTDISASAGIIDSSHSTSATFVDVNQDGFLDIYVGNYVENEDPLLDSAGNLIGYASTCYPNYLYLNNGFGGFSELSSSMGINSSGCALAVTSTNYNNDQWVDLMVANDFGIWLTPNQLFQNSSMGFSDVSGVTGANTGMFGMGIAIGDFDEDLDLDYYITNIGPNVLLENNSGAFTDMASSYGLLNDSVGSKLTTGWSTFFFDADNDSYLDLFATNGHIPMPPNFYETFVSDPNVMYEFDGSNFSDISISSGLADSSMSHGCAYGDFNNDGLIDLVVANTDTSTSSVHNSKVYLNNSASGNYIKVLIEGTTSNRDGFGAHVYCYSGGRIFMREVDGGSGHASHNSSIVHFGLAALSTIDSIVVNWPSGITDVVTPGINTTINIIEGFGTNIHENDYSFKMFPNPAGNVVYIQKHHSTRTYYISIFSSDGRLVKNLSTNLDSLEVDMSNLESGNYYIVINDFNEVVTRKLVKL